MKNTMLKYINEIKGKVICGIMSPDDAASELGTIHTIAYHHDAANTTAKAEKDAEAVRNACADAINTLNLPARMQEQVDKAQEALQATKNTMYDNNQAGEFDYAMTKLVLELLPSLDRGQLALVQMRVAQVLESEQEADDSEKALSFGERYGAARPLTGAFSKVQDDDTVPPDYSSIELRIMAQIEKDAAQKGDA